jgi:hypothetical protein
MTVQQLDAIKALSERCGASLDYVDVIHDPFDLPKGWVFAVVCKPEPGKAPHLCNQMAIMAGVSPEGGVHT